MAADLHFLLIKAHSTPQLRADEVVFVSLPAKSLETPLQLMDPLTFQA
jgi:hypothetical protein